MPHINLDEYGPLPVILPEEQKRAPAAPVDLDRFRTFSEQRGALTMPRQTAIERPDVPEALQAIEQYIIAPAGGIAAAAPLLPVAGITGVGAGALPFTESAAFSAGTIGTEALLRQLNKALGYRVPKAPSVGELGIEAGATALAYPLGNIPSLLKTGAENVLGLTAREQARSKAATEMSSKLAKLPDLHGKVADIADRVGGQIPSAMSAAEKQAVRQGRETAATAGKRMVAGVPPVASEAELAASGRDLSAAAELRTRTIGQLGTHATQTCV